MFSLNQSFLKTLLLNDFCSEFENCVCLLLKEDYCGFTNDIILCFIYISPEGYHIYDLPATQINGIEIFEDTILSNIVASYPDATLFWPEILTAVQAI